MNINLKKFFIYSIIIIVFIAMQNNIVLSYILYSGLFVYGITSLRRGVSTIIYMFIISSLNENLVIQNPTASLYKWTILFVTFLYVLIFKIKQRKVVSLKSTLFLVMFIIINLLSSIIFNINLKVSIMKLIAYCVGIYTLVNGIIICKKRYNWIEWIYYVLTSIVIVSGITLLLGNNAFYIRNSKLFTGIWIHPNIYGVIVTIGISYFLFFVHDKLDGKLFKNINLSISGIGYLTVLLSKSRMSIIISSLTIVLFLIISIKKLNNKKIVLVSIVAILSIIFGTIYSNKIDEAIKEIIFKNDSVDILFSRREQINRVLNSFYDSPLIGKGFGVDENIEMNVSFASAPVEKGNIILAIISESGIVGLVLFLIYLIVFIFENKRQLNKKLILVILVILLTNLSEMTYFSMSNVGILNCFFMGLYASLRDINSL